MRDPAGKAAPAGGFQNGGWYSGYQYFNGSFAPQAGVIHPQSNQQGAGQAVSAEVNRQTSVAAGKAPDANQNYVNQQNATVTPQPGGAGSAGRVNIPAAGAGGSGAGIGVSSPDVLNLPKLYENLYASSGVKDLQDELLKNEADYNTAQSAINDNPWLSEASRTGRLQKLSMDYQNRVANKQNELATKKADIQMQLDLQTKQFDINSQAAQQSLNQFNTLLQMGALDNASGDDIANITRSTGLSSSAIYSAIDANKKKNTQTSIIQYDDGTNQGFAVIDQNGNILNRQVIAGSAPSKSGGGGKPTKDEEAAGNIDSLKQSINSGTTLKSLVNYYAGVIPVEDIYRYYNLGSPNGKAKESLKQVQAGNFKY